MQIRLLLYDEKAKFSEICFFKGRLIAVQAHQQEYYTKKKQVNKGFLGFIKNCFTNILQLCLFWDTIQGEKDGFREEKV